MRLRAPSFRFQTRLLLTYTLLVFLLVLVIGVAVFRNYARFLERSAEESYGLVVDRVARQIDDLFNTMDFIVVNLVSDAAFKDALVNLKALDRADPEVGVDVQNAAEVVSQSIAMHSFHKAEIDVVVNTAAGDLFSSNFIDHERTRGRGSWGALPSWADRVFEADGPAKVVGPFRDPWDALEPGQLFGIARSIRGAEGSLGIVGAYQRIESLNGILRAPNDESVAVAAFAPDGRVLHSTAPLSPEQEAYLSDQTASSTGFVPNPVTGKRQFVAVSQLETGWGRVVAVVDRTVLLESLYTTQWLLLGLGAFVLLLSVAYNWFSSRALTRPLRVVQQHIEETDIGNLAAAPPLEHHNDELVSLDRAFNRMKERLDEAIRREMSSRTASMQARLDSLQAQINPHFLYNTLTVIANRGLELGDEEIGEMCDGIASMLRYSTATTERDATVGEELDHLRSYLFIMEKRLENRLEVTINVDPRITEARMPKIVLQQFVENSIHHGYLDLAEPVVIDVTGRVVDGWWELTITDQGAGFPDETLSRLTAEMGAIHREIDTEGPASGLRIGGLGLLNTYTRMHLFYRGEFLWRMENRPGGGALVTLGASLGRQAGGPGGGGGEP